MTSISDPIITSVLCGMLIECVQYLLAVAKNCLGLRQKVSVVRRMSRWLSLSKPIVFDQCDLTNNIHISYTHRLR